MDLTPHRPIAVGSPHRRMIKTSIKFERDTFEEIRARAKAARHSFAEEVRVLIETGLETCE